MKIATWNLERPRQTKRPSEKNRLISERLRSVDADIWVLTETNSCIDLRPDYEPFASEELEPCEKCNYTRGENRSTVWVRRTFPAKRERVSDPLTSACVSVSTNRGDLVVYRTVIGPFGHPSLNVDEQIEDWRRVQADGRDVCIAGDFNIQFSRSDRFTDGSKVKVASCLKNLRLVNLTSGIDENIDHIVISSRRLTHSPHSETHLWNLEKERHVPKLSDHIGVAVQLKD